jgi:hypothetical protein
VNQLSDTPEHLPTVRRRAYEVQAQEYYPLDATAGGGGDGMDVRRLMESLWRWK